MPLFEPQYSGLSDAEFLTNAIDQPFSRAETVGTGAFSALMDSPGIGTVIKSLTAPQGRQYVTKDDESRVAPTNMNDLTTVEGSPLRLETDAELAQRGEKAYGSEQNYKASAEYRADVPYSDNLTVSRAKALAEYSDYKAIRNQIMDKRPVWAFAGQTLGSALDPINYIPVLGEASMAAATGRLGVVGGRALIGGADAALNVGVANLITAPIRQQFGDDISWQSQVSQIALGAAIGAGVGAIGGAFHTRADARAEAFRKDMEGRFATIQNGQEAMATLREAVAGLANDGEVKLSDSAVDRLDGLHGRMADAAPEIRARVAETPASYADRMLAETMPDELRRLAEIDRAIDSNQRELESLRAESMDNERFGSTRAAFIEARELDAKYQRLADAAEKATSDKQRAQLQTQAEAVQARVQAIFDKLDPATVDRLEQLELSIPLRERALTDAKAAREPLAGTVEELRQGLIKEYLGRTGEATPELKPVKDFERTPDTEPLARNMEMPVAQWAPESRARNDAGDLVPVYHGTFSKFERFNREKLGSETSAGSAREGFFFSENKDVASGYAKDDPYQDGFLRTLNKLTLGGYKRLNQALFKMFGKSVVKEGRVVTAHLDAKNPLVVEYGGRDVDEKEVAEILRRAKEDGHDAVKFKSISDPGYTDASGAIADNWVVFDPAQIKIVDHGDAGLNARAEQGRRMEADRQEIIRRFIEEAERPKQAIEAGADAIPARAAREVIAMAPTPERTSQEARLAEQKVGKPEAPKAIAEANGVNPETGDFAEMYQLEQLEAEGRMTAEDRETMKVANDNVKAAEAWGDALRAAAACLL